MNSRSTPTLFISLVFLLNTNVKSYHNLELLHNNRNNAAVFTKIIEIHVESYCLFQKGKNLPFWAAFSISSGFFSFVKKKLSVKVTENSNILKIIHMFDVFSFKSCQSSPLFWLIFFSGPNTRTYIAVRMCEYCY